jgi:hypothetical protein
MLVAILLCREKGMFDYAGRISNISSGLELPKMAFYPQVADQFAQIVRVHAASTDNFR